MALCPQVGGCALLPCGGLWCGLAGTLHDQASPRPAPTYQLGVRSPAQAPLRDALAGTELSHALSPAQPAGGKGFSDASAPRGAQGGTPMHGSIDVAHAC